MRKHKISGKTITLKIKYSDFSLQTRSKTLPYFINDKDLILDIAKELLYQEKLRESVRLLGISVNNLNSDGKLSIKQTKDQKSISVQLKINFQ